MNKFLTLLNTLMVSCTLVIGCHSGDQSKAADAKETQPVFDLTAARKEIDSLNLVFMAMVAKGDSLGLTNFYTIDAKMMAPNGPAIVGRKNIQSALTGLVNSGLAKLSLTTVGLWGDEAMLAEEGVVAEEAKDGKQLDRGKYIVLWKKEDGNWKLFRDFFNSDLPVPSSK